MKGDSGLGKAAELVGKKYSNLTVIQRVGSLRGAAAWLCRCECGDTTIATTGALLNGHKTSCGCLRGRQIDDLTGNRFGKLVVLGLDRKEYYVAYKSNRKRGRVYWSCVCDCGLRCSVLAPSLLSGHTKSCGCLYREKEPVIRYGYGRGRNVSINAPLRAYYHSVLRSARVRGLEFSLTIEDVLELSSKDCFYCGDPPEQTKVTKNHPEIRFVYNGIDRVDNTLGYVADNVVPCCKHCNFAKRKLTLDEFKSWVRKVYSHLGLENTL